MKAKPTPRQLEFLDWEFGMFFHFGIRSFFPGHLDWDGKPMPAAAFNPKQLDCLQWVRVAQKAGAKYCILTCKHHDGFANWQSNHSDYSVRQSPWEDGKGDVVREFVKACRMYNMKVGLYYSPAEWGGSVKFENGKEYDDYFIAQISELCSNYGPIDILWFDACGSEKHEFDQARILAEIRRLQPNALLNMWDPDSRWVGNEDGYASIINFSETDSKDFTVSANPERDVEGKRFLPAECDCTMREITWFDCQYNADTIKKKDELVGMWEHSVGNGATFLLGIGPNADGVLPDADVKRLFEFTDEIKRRYSAPLGFSAPVQDESGALLWKITTPDSVDGWNWPPKGCQLVDAIMLEEDISEGEAIEEFRIYARLAMFGQHRTCIYSGFSVGHKKLCRFPTIKTSQLTLEVRKANGEVKLKSFKAFYTNANQS